MKNRYLEDVKRLLGAYKIYKGRLKILHDMERELDQDGGITSVRYDGMPGGGMAGSSVERIAEHNMGERERIQTEKQQCIIFLRRIDMALQNLTELKAEIIKMKYIECRCWNEIVDIVGYSESACTKEARKGIKELAIQLIGLQSLEVEEGNHKIYKII